LKKYTRDFTELAKQKKLDPVIGREEEVERAIEILSRRTKNNPVLIGEAGVGKTAIVEGLAQKIVDGDVPKNLVGRKIVGLDMGALVAGTQFRGEFEQRLKLLVDEVIKSKGKIILFIDEMHNLVGAGRAEGSLDASNMLKPALARGEMQVIGATTIDEYRKYIEKDRALERRFQPILVKEPTVEQTIEILKGLRKKYEEHHKVKITDDALVQAAKLSYRYITERRLPDKAIDLIDEAAARLKLQLFSMPDEIKVLENRLKRIQEDGESAVIRKDYEKAAELKKESDKVSEEYIMENSEWAHWYARDVIKGRWPEAEEYIMKDPEWAYWYARDVIRERWSESEEYIKKNPELAYLYALDIIKDRWPEAEKYIRKNPEWACLYARTIIKDRWPEAEEYIMKDPKQAYWYAREIIKDRWLEAEEYIIKDSVWAHWYARDVIKDRWPEAEECIMKD